MTTSDWINLAVAIVGAVATWIWRNKVAKETRETECMKALEAAVEEAWTTFGKKLKQDSDDQKLTDSEKSELLTFAINRARGIAKERGVDLLKVMGERVLPALIREIVERRKS
jgi:gas vesicle protein